MVDIKFIHGDCLEEMPKLADKSIDMILCDLPYGTTACKWDVVIPFNKYVQIGKKVIYEQEYVFDKMKSGVSYKEALEDFLSISKDGLWDNYKRIIKDRGAIVLFGSEPFSSYLRMSNIKQYRYDWVWHKNTSGGFATAKKLPMKYHEMISVFYKESPTYNPQFQEYADSTKHRFKDGERVNRDKQVETSTNSIQGGLSFAGEQGIEISRGKYPESVQFFNSIPNCNGTKLHPTQKPVDLLEYLIKTYTLEGETVLDNCMGSGSTGVACVNTKRNFIGIEKDDKYFEIAKKRIEEHLTTAST